MATDVGDSRQIMESTGLIVAPRDPDALATAWGSLIDMDECERRKMGRLARQRIARHFSIEMIVRRYENIYSDLALYRPRFR